MPTNKNSLSKPEEVPTVFSNQEITKIIATSSAKASAIAVLPVPIIDIAGVTFIQLTMVNEIAEKYGVKSGDKTNLLIISLASNIIARLIVEATEKLAASTKVNKLLGESLIKATISGFVTTITGEVYADHFRKGGSYHNLSLHNTIDYFKRQLSSDRVSAENVMQLAVSSISDKFNI